MNYSLISFELCPFVQRSVITLLEKNIPFERTYLTLEELYQPPDWFIAVSPFKKVPVLRLGEVSLFESAVICEYLDEVNPPSMHPADPLQKALNRAWIVFAEGVIMSHYRCFTAETEEDHEKNRLELDAMLDQLETVLGAGPFFNGEDFCLIDAAFAPAFMRIEMLDRRHNSKLFHHRPKLQRWVDSCLEKPSVLQSLPEGFEEKFIRYIRDRGGYCAKTYA